MLKRSSFGLPDKHATALVLGYAVAYGALFLLGRYTIGLFEFSLWFPAAGLRFAALLIFGWRFAVIAAIGELAVQGILGEWSKWGSGFEIQMICGVAGPPLIYGLVAWGLQRSGLNLRPLNFRHTIWLLAAGMIAPALTAPVSTGFLHLADRLPMEAFWPATLSFWVGDAVGIFMLAPLLLAIWLGRSWNQTQRRSGVELKGASSQRTALIEIGTVLAASIGLFILLGLPHDPTFWYPAFLPVAVLSMRHHWMGAIPAIFTFNVMAAWVAAGLDEPTERLDLQVFLIVLSASGLLIAAIVKDRERAEALQRKQLNEFARESRREALSDMASPIVHELKGPVTAASSFVATALGKLDRETVSESETRYVLQAVHGHIERIKTIFLSISQMGTTNDDTSVRFDIRDAVTDALAILFIAAKPHGVEIKTELGDEPVYVKGIQAQLQQVIVNLARNGIEAMEGKFGRLSISVKVSAETVSVVVKDEGIGFDADALPELMEPFQTGKAAGTGLGLAIVKAIIEAHGGSLTATSDANTGSTFVVRLPRLAKG